MTHVVFNSSTGFDMRIFGLDIGTTSIGFAVIDLDKNRHTGNILRLGVRIFPEARDPDGTPLNQQRRAKRMMRRQLRRRRERRRSLNSLLASSGLLPAFGGDAWRNTMALDPYDLRARGLNGPLLPHQLGRALYHLSKRRHFKERDPAETGENTADPETEGTAPAKKGAKAATVPKDDNDGDEAESTEARKHLVAALKDSGQTLGQLLAGRSSDARRRGEHATRAIVADEFARIIATQAEHHAVLRDPQILGAIEEAIFAQRPVFWRKSTLGKCTLMPDEPLCPRGSWLSQERRMLEKVNNLALAGGNARQLDAPEREAILAALRTQKSMTWPGVRKALEPIFKARGESTRTLKFNLEAGDDDKGGLKGNIVEADLAKIFGRRWETHPRKQDLRELVPDALWQADYGEVGTQRVVIRPEKDRAERRKLLARQLVEEFDATAGDADAIIKLHFPQGWEPYSTEALRLILPELQKGERFGALIASPEFTEWRDENFPQREQPTGEFFDRLPSPRADTGATLAQREEAERIATVRNPTVVRVQNELRKVVNNLVGLYGKPDLIRLELAREIGKSKREREEMSKGIRKRENQRKKARDDLIENGRADPSDDDVEKWLLWKESGEQCPYTGEKIGFDDLFSGNPRFDVEHIWPRSKSLDNSFRNKTLCRKDINLTKGNRIPLEYFAGDSDGWQAAKDRIWKMVGKEAMNPGKARRFCAESMPSDFASRQLNDTGYAARQAKGFLERLWPDVGPTGNVHVQPVTGKVTAQLRRRWGLNHLLADSGEKTRADHRHHAIDALVVACADGGYTQKLQRYFEQESEYRRGKGRKPNDAIVDPPWEDINDDARRAVGEIVVSHRVRRKVSGPLHEEQPLGYTKQTTEKNGVKLGIYVKRVPVEKLGLETLKIHDVQQIPRVAKFVVRDSAIRTTLSAHLKKTGKPPAKSYPPYPTLGPTGPEIRKVRVLTTQQRALMVPVSKNGFADPANNHHIAIYHSLSDEVTLKVVTLFEASARLARRAPIVSRTDEHSSILAMSLASGDTLHFRSGNMAGYWIVKSVWASGQIVLWRVNDALGDSAVQPKATSILRSGGRKVSVDPIGRVRPAND